MDGIIENLKLKIVAEKPPPSGVIEQAVLASSEGRKLEIRPGPA